VNFLNYVFFGIKIEINTGNYAQFTILAEFRGATIIFSE